MDRVNYVIKETKTNYFETAEILNVCGIIFIGYN